MSDKSSEKSGMKRRDFLRCVSAGMAGLVTASATSQLQAVCEVAAPVLNLTRGDVFTIAGVYARNPMTDQLTGFLQHFVITADFSSEDDDADIQFWPKLVDDVTPERITLMCGPWPVQYLPLGCRVDG